MVNNRVNIGAWAGQPVPNAGESRKIDGGPLYPAATVLPLLHKAALNFWTKDCIKDAANLGLDTVDAAKLLVDALSNGSYKDSEWCDQKPGGPIAACDAYVLIRKEWNKYTFSELTCEYFLKFAVSKTGSVILLVSCHT